MRPLAYLVRLVLDNDDVGYEDRGVPFAASSHVLMSGFCFVVTRAHEKEWRVSMHIEQHGGSVNKVILAIGVSSSLRIFLRPELKYERGDQEA